MSVNPLADAFSKIKNYERIGKREVIIAPASKLIGRILEILKERGFVEEYEFLDDGKAGKFRLTLAGRINDCGVITPRHAVKNDEYEKWEKRYMPAAGFGIMIVSTPKGVMAHQEAMEKGLGGRLIAYVY